MVPSTSAPAAIGLREAEGVGEHRGQRHPALNRCSRNSSAKLRRRRGSFGREAGAQVVALRRSMDRAGWVPQTVVLMMLICTRLG